MNFCEWELASGGFMAKILVVDDSDAIRTQLRKDLETKAHVVVEAINGSDGLAKLNETEGVELIISDVNMPVMDGLSMCAKIRENPKYNAVKIFMLTTEASADMKTKGVAAGVKAWIVKPYVIDKLLMAVEKVLQK